MKLVSHKLCLVVASAALVLAGCSKKPRPDPSLTVMGQTPGGSSAGIIQPPTQLGNMGGNLIPDRGPEIDPNAGDRMALEKQTVYFDFDQSAVKASEREKLKAAKEHLEKNPTHRLVLEGHADWRGTAEYNLGLGDRRANAVKKYLESVGVKPDRLETISKGSLEAVKEGGDAVWAKDRRVNLVIFTTPKPPGAL